MCFPKAKRTYLAQNKNIVFRGMHFEVRGYDSEVLCGGDLTRMHVFLRWRNKGSDFSKSGFGQGTEMASHMGSIPEIF